MSLTQASIIFASQQDKKGPSQIQFLDFSVNAAALNGGLASVTLQERRKPEYLLDHIRSHIMNTDIMPSVVVY